MRLARCLLAAAALASVTAQGAERPRHELYAYCVEMGLPKIRPRPLAEQAALLRELGYNGIGWQFPLDGPIETDLGVLDRTGLRLHMTWATLNVNPTKGAAYPAGLPAMIGKLKGRGTVVSVLLAGLKPADPAGFDPAVKALRELGDVASEAGLRISIYNHVNNWTESLPFITDLVRRVDHPAVGFNFNLCHWLKLEGDKDYSSLLRENAAKLFCVTINGAEIGAKTWTHGLIQPLDRGNFDNRRLLGLLDDIGYEGAIGIMCYGVPDDPKEHLARSMAKWHDWRMGRP